MQPISMILVQICTQPAESLRVWSSKRLNIPLNYELSKPHFDDVPPIINQDALWDYSYIETAAREGIIRGTQPRTFEPTANLTRADAAVFLARALDLKLETDPTKIDKGLAEGIQGFR